MQKEPQTREEKLKRRRDTVAELITKMERRIEDGEKVTISDYVRLIELERELTDEEEGHLKEIRVQWIETLRTSEIDS